MLIEFSVENYRSFKDKVSFSMLASSDDSLQKNLIKDESILKKNSLLRSAVIYGANASGKTNVLRALNNLRNHVTRGSKRIPGEEIPLTPFKFDKICENMPYKAYIDFIHKGIRYNYDLILTSEKVLEEHLYYYPNGVKAVIFERTDTNEYRFTVDKSKQKDLAERTLDNVLYLSNSAQQNYEKTIEPFKWFSDSLHTIGPTDNVDSISTSEFLNKNETNKNMILKALALADFNILDITANIEHISINDLPDEISKILEKGKDSIEDIMQEDIKCFHRGVDENNNSISIPLSFRDESDGTQKMFSLMGPWLDSLKKTRVLVLDELDTKLHPHLCLFLLDYFNNPDLNTANSQLVFTTHNTKFLDLDIFRRDQIWFTEKDVSAGVTDLFSLLEFKPRKDTNIEKGYLSGRFGATPFIRSSERIFDE